MQNTNKSTSFWSSSPKAVCCIPFHSPLISLLITCTLTVLAKQRQTDAAITPVSIKRHQCYPNYKEKLKHCGFFFFKPPERFNYYAFSPGSEQFWKKKKNQSRSVLISSSGHFGQRNNYLFSRSSLISIWSSFCRETRGDPLEIWRLGSIHLLSQFTVNYRRVETYEAFIGCVGVLMAARVCARVCVGAGLVWCRETYSE